MKQKCFILTQTYSDKEKLLKLIGKLSKIQNNLQIFSLKYKRSFAFIISRTQLNDSLLINLGRFLYFHYSLPKTILFLFTFVISKTLICPKSCCTDFPHNLSVSHLTIILISANFKIQYFSSICVHFLPSVVYKFLFQLLYPVVLFCS